MIELNKMEYKERVLDEYGGVALRVSNLHRNRLGYIEAEVSAEHPYGNIIVSKVIISLSNRGERERLAKDLIKNVDDVFIPWDKLIEELFSEAIDEFESKPSHPLTATRLDMVDSEVVRWLWYPYLPLGKITILGGDPGEGKSFISNAIATALSIGGPLPNSNEPQQCKTLILSAEDGMRDTIRPRLAAMGADLSQINVLNELFNLDDDGVQALDSFIQNNPEGIPRLVVIDPVASYLSSKLDINRSNHVRSALSPLAALAEKWELAILGIRHLTKDSAGKKAIYRGSGSIDFTGQARSELLAGSDPDDPTNKGLLHIKHNLSPAGDPIGYAIDGQGRFTWKTTCDLTYERMTAMPDRSKLQDAEDFLTEYLADGSKPALEVEDAAQQKGISSQTLRRAREKLGVSIIKQTQPGKKGGGRSLWGLKNE